MERRKGYLKDKSRKKNFICRSQETNGHIYFSKNNVCPSRYSNQTVVKTATVEMQTEITWPNGLKQPKKCAVEEQTTEKIKPVQRVRRDPHSASHNDTINENKPNQSIFGQKISGI